MEDQRIIQLFLDRNEEALIQIREKYGAYCHSLSYGILNNEADAEEVVNDAWLRVWNAIPPQQPVVLKMFLAKTVRNLSLNFYRDRNAQKRGGGEVELALEELNQCIPAPGGVQEALEGRELAKVIQAFLLTQNERDRGIFVCRYFVVEPVDRIARKYGLTEANTRKILFRTRSKLKDYLTKEGYTV